MGLILITAVNWFAEILLLAMVIRAVFSWFVRDPYSTLGKIYMGIIKFTEPFVAPCRNLIDRIGINTGMLDFSVFVAMLLIEVVARVITVLLYMIF